jgi:dynein heavy chain 1
LEKIKTEASEIMQKVEETDIVLNEVEKVSHEYLPMAKACSSIFFTLSSLSAVRNFTKLYLYFFFVIIDSFSLSIFTEIFYGNI